MEIHSKEITELTNDELHYVELRMIQMQKDLEREYEECSLARLKAERRMLGINLEHAGNKQVLRVVSEELKLRDRNDVETRERD